MESSISRNRNGPPKRWWIGWKASKMAAAPELAPLPLKTAQKRTQRRNDQEVEERRIRVLLQP